MAAAKKTGSGPKKAPAKKTAPKKATTKSAAKRPASTKKAASAATPTKKKQPAAKSPARKQSALTTSPSTKKKAPAKKAASTKAPAKKAPKKAPAKKASAAKVPAKKKAPAKKSRARKKAPKKAGAGLVGTPSILSNEQPDRIEVPAPRGVTKDGVAYTKDFDVKFLKAQLEELQARRAGELARATRLEDEATSLIEDGEMGDVQFDDEGGEGDTMVVQRDLDRVLSSQARQTVAEIDAAIARIGDGTYGYSEVSGRPIPRERLEAIPETTVLAEEKVSGIGR